MVATGWTDAQRRAYVLADNKLAQNAGWDAELLGLELGELVEAGADLALAGFSPDELAEILGTAEQVGFPELPDGDKEPFEKITFALHADQAATVREALQAAREISSFDNEQNQNGNGNALARICETFLSGR